ncbi:hypothetical protein IAQ67_26480 [Paenibacillus peoriae]|uniref:Uncharacterized protein n=1 Tax=Paenibacillus peoriae TaxID=59893 RepID=A0A7H0Y848_9BACL|nr:hypothetical protein [Paenibacillus peoriae]QNR67256.1 hypothetical protein IAQ67_26480 [Paenibacillus peoriae]
MKILWIFTLFMILMLGTILLVNWLFGTHTPWEPMALAFSTMRPSEYIVLAAMLLLLFVNEGKKQIGNAFRFLFSRWSRFLRVPSSNSASSHQSNQKKQNGEKVNK